MESRLHICGITSDGKLWHISRPMPSDGSVSSWSSWEEIRPKTENALGPFIQAGE